MNVNVVFSFEGKNILIQANHDDMFAEIVNRYCTKSGITEKDKPKFFVNGKEIPYTSYHSLSDLQINDNAKIEVVKSGGLVAAL